MAKVAHVSMLLQINSINLLKENLHQNLWVEATPSRISLMCFCVHTYICGSNLKDEVLYLVEVICLLLYAHCCHYSRPPDEMRWKFRR